MRKIKAIWNILFNSETICVVPSEWEGVIIDYKDKELKMYNLTEEELAEMLTTNWIDEEIDNIDTDTNEKEEEV